MTEPVDLNGERHKRRRKVKNGSGGGGGGTVEYHWTQGCMTSNNGKPIPNLANADLGMTLDPLLSGLVKFDEMARFVLLTGPPPLHHSSKSRQKLNGSWQHVGENGQDICEELPNVTESLQDIGKYPRIISDNDTNLIQKFLQLSGICRLSRDTTLQAIEMRAHENPFHPIKAYLSGLKWDGHKRLGGWTNTYLGVDHNNYTSRVGAMFLIAMVARIFRPGCKSDYMLILEGPQGALKSTACRILAGGWFSDSLPDLSKSDPVRLSMHLRGKWLIEIAEMSSFDTVETHTLKEFLTQTEERYLPKYGRCEVFEPRQCLFIGTTNQSVYLRDETGARRFWPITVREIDIQALERDRDQLFAEAVHLFQNGAHWWPDAAFEEQYIKPQQNKRYDSDIWETLIRDKILGRNEVTTLELAKDPLNLQIGMIHSGVNKRISRILKNLGWELQHTRKGNLWKKM